MRRVKSSHAHVVAVEASRTVPLVVLLALVAALCAPTASANRGLPFYTSERCLSDPVDCVMGRCLEDVYACLDACERDPVECPIITIGQIVVHEVVECGFGPWKCVSICIGPGPRIDPDECPDPARDTVRHLPPFNGPPP